MGDLIGGPLQAAAESQAQLTSVMLEYLSGLGFTEDELKGAKQITFKLNRPIETPEGLTDKVAIQLPLLSIIPIPPMLVDSVEVDFQMEAKESGAEEGEAGH